MTLRADDWSRLDRAFRRGASAAARPSAPDGQRIFESSLETAIRAYVPAAQQLRLKVIEGRRRQALHAARAGQLNAAEALLAEAARLIDAPATDATVVRPFAEAFLHAVAAYVSYRRHDWPGACTHLRAAFARDAELMTRNLHILEMHRVQLAHNWMRVLARQGGDMDAAALGVGLIGYVRSRGDAACWPDALACVRHAPIDWAPLPGALIAAMAQQLTCELAVCLARLDAAAHAPLLAPLAPLAATHDDAAAQYVRILAARAAGEGAALMATAPGFLEHGRDASVFLWEALVYELLRSEDHPDPDGWERAAAARPSQWSFLPLTGGRVGRRPAEAAAAS